MKAYAIAIFRALLPSLRHTLARVRAAALGALGAVVAVPDRAKCRSVGAAAIEELVGFRRDNVLSVASFYRPDVEINHLAEVCGCGCLHACAPNPPLTRTDKQADRQTGRQDRSFSL
jgi:hypothetical protein